MAGMEDSIDEGEALDSQSSPPPSPASPEDFEYPTIDMAPNPTRNRVAKDRFPALFSTLKTQTYYDSSSRGAYNIRTIAFSPTGHLIATGSTDRTLRIWNPDKPTVKNSTELRGHGGAVVAVAWNPTKEAELASVSTDGTCKIWDVRLGSKGCLGTLQLGAEALTCVWSPDGSTVIVGRKVEEDDILVPITFTDKGSPVAGVPMPQIGQTNQLLFPHHPTDAPPTKLFLTTSKETVDIAEYPAKDGQLKVLHSLHGHTSATLSQAMSPTGRYLAIGGSDANISLWDTHDWVCRRTLWLEGPVKTVSFSWDGSFIAGGTDEGTGIEIAHVETGDVVYTIPTTTPTPCVAWHPQRYWLAYSGDPQGLKIVGAAGGSL